jgi:hypothetical protein
MNTKKDEKSAAFALEDFKLKPISSAETIKQNLIISEDDEDILSLNAAPQRFAAADTAVAETEELTDPVLTAEEAELTEIADPIFKELSAPKLPELSKENRARLQMQSPNKIYFYWSFKQNPFQTLSRVFGKQVNYQMVVKLLNRTNGREDIFPADAEGSAWFDVDADSTYRAEIGFYATNRPFVRVMFSNTVETPRKNPSPRRDYSPNFTVSANQFAEVLDVSGFQQDAFEVALAGDDIESADDAAQIAFSQIIGAPPSDYNENLSSEIRFILLALASGYSIENLRGHISPSLFAILQGNAEKISMEKALSALQENFGVLSDETHEEESFGATVFGASLINFPRASKRRVLPKFAPISSLTEKYF